MMKWTRFWVFPSAQFPKVPPFLYVECCRLSCLINFFLFFLCLYCLRSLFWSFSLLCFQKYFQTHDYFCPLLCRLTFLWLSHFSVATSYFCGCLISVLPLFRIRREYFCVVSLITSHVVTETGMNRFRTLYFGCFINQKFNSLITFIVACIVLYETNLI
jgi:hypothetical protein